MEAAENKSGRWLQFIELLLAYPQGLTRAEIARRLNVHRSTAGRYVDQLSGKTHSIPIYDDGNLVRIDRDHYQFDVSLTLHESMAIHLATRLMATRIDKQNRHAASALRKLGRALEKLAPLISNHLLASAEVMDSQGLRYDPNYLRVLEVLTKAWSAKQLVHVWHRSETMGRVFEYDFAPYFIEPYAVGRTTHVIGQAYPPDKLRTFKLERIERAELKEDGDDIFYNIPAAFNLTEKLADAWGIWYTENEPQKIVLKFHPRVANRVKETGWHRSQQMVEQNDGYLLWQAWIAEPQEMLPWIRGWGADCEVLEPEGLRNKMIGETRKLAKIYGWATHKKNRQTADTPSLSQTFNDFFGD